jgi:N-acetylmuramoyl-L-alanine amidase
MRKNNPQFIILHTAAHGTVSVAANTTAAEIDVWHKAKGWRGIGYHYVVRFEGDIQNGRPEGDTGAHCESMGMNTRSIGICFSGHGDYHDWTAAQEASGLQLISTMMDKYHIPLEHVLGHRETGAKKTCPGNRIDMELVRQKISAIRKPALGWLNRLVIKNAFSQLYKPSAHYTHETLSLLNQLRNRPEFKDI